MITIGATIEDTRSSPGNQLKKEESWKEAHCEYTNTAGAYRAAALNILRLFVGTPSADSAAAGIAIADRQLRRRDGQRDLWFISV